MKPLPIIIVLVAAVLVGTAYAGVVLSRFDARTDGNDIVVSWEATAETDVEQYVLERKTRFDAQYVEMARFEPKGANQLYTYRDVRVFKIESEQIAYRLRVINEESGFDVTDAILVDYTPTAVRRTWGSIKAMFL